MNNEDKLVTLIPLVEIEESAQQQIQDVLNQSFLIKLAVMPDVHAGYHMPIGGVALLDNVISPSFTGYDIGCGISHIRTHLKIEDLDDLQELYVKIKDTIPNGEGQEQKVYMEYPDFPNASNNIDLFQKVQAKLHTQLSSMGGGNHFLELGTNPDGFVCVTIHSGSRNPGHSVGGYYMKLAKTNDTDLPEGFFHLNSELGQAYLTDMNFMLDFALANRKMMMEQILMLMGTSSFGVGVYINNDMINENHNHAIVNPDGTVLHRKGATSADKGQFGVIPGNMRDGVYVTIGLGNEEYLSSASHGAGRTMSRKKARESIELDTFKTQMEGIVSGVEESILDEAPDAYKNIDHVIKLQEGIVIDVLYKTKPILNVKGSGSTRPWDKKGVKRT